MAPILLSIILHLLRQSFIRTYLGITTILHPHSRNRLILASAATGILLSLLVGTNAANTQIFTPVETPTPDQNEAVDQVGGWFYFANWVDRGMTIRSGPDVRMCLLNLAKALEEVQVLSAAEYNGAAGALSLLPTAGALLGAPTREMWIVYKLVPIAGILSMFLSMGATITPSDVGEYESGKAFSFSGIMPMRRTDAAHGDNEDERDEEGFRELSDSKRFARDVKARANHSLGGDVSLKIWFAIFCQLFFIGVILVAMWYSQRGSVIPWWCRVWGWMFFWYFIIIITSVFDNIVAAPFTYSWTLRVARAPSKIHADSISPESRVTSFDRNLFPTVMDRLKAGVKLNHRVSFQENDKSAYSRTCFYVVISVQGISAWHGSLQLLSRMISIVVFGFGTALFASATLMSISAALMLLALVLPMAFAGRVVAMWIAAEMNKYNKSILHTVVKTKKEAGEYMEEIFDVSGLQIETMGHIILDGICFKRRSPFLSAATYIGLLAKPYTDPAVKKAVKEQRQDSIPMLQMQGARLEETEGEVRQSEDPESDVPELRRKPKRYTAL